MVVTVAVPVNDGLKVLEGVEEAVCEFDVVIAAEEVIVWVIVCVLVVVGSAVTVVLGDDVMEGVLEDV